MNHEAIARLPHRPESQREIGLHAVREANYGALFLGLGWFAWHGALALAVAALLVAEIFITAFDEFEENRTRLLPQNERVMHVFLTVNLGALAALMGPVLFDWYAEPTGVARRDLGPIAWLLTALAAAAFSWSARDFVAWRRLARANRSA